MSNFFEVTTDDLINVAKQRGIDINHFEALNLMLEMDLDFEHELVNVTDIDEQTKIVYGLLSEQLGTMDL